MGSFIWLGLNLPSCYVFSRPSVHYYFLNLFLAFSYIDFGSTLLNSMKKRICWGLYWNYIYYVDHFVVVWYLYAIESSCPGTWYVTHYLGLIYYLLLKFNFYS